MALVFGLDGARLSPARVNQVVGDIGDIPAVLPDRREDGCLALAIAEDRHLSILTDL
jgi:hypothetical protein